MKAAELGTVVFFSRTRIAVCTFVHWSLLVELTEHGKMRNSSISLVATDALFKFFHCSCDCI